MARIAGTREIQVDVKSPDGGEKYLAQLRPRLLSLLNSSLPAIERAEAGRVLAKFGDPRPEVLDVNAMQFCFVPAGKFIMGEGKEQKQVDLPAYWISKYPITNAQFQQFVEAGGYRQKEFWGEAIKEGYWQDGAFKGRYDYEPRDRPVDYGEPSTLGNHPVVGISWYEALAFARWLEALLQSQFQRDATKGKVRRRQNIMGRIGVWSCARDLANRSGVGEGRAGHRWENLSLGRRGGPKPRQLQ